MRSISGSCVKAPSTGVISTVGTDFTGALDDKDPVRTVVGSDEITTGGLNCEFRGRGGGADTNVITTVVNGEYPFLD
jgi:hypothetical protein